MNNNGVVEADSSVCKGLEYAIDQTWNGEPVDHIPVRVRMDWKFERQPGKPHKRVIKVNFKAPLFDDEPPDDLPGPLPGLWNYEVVEFFFANDKGQYLEVEVGPHGHWICLLFDSVRKPFNTGEEVTLEVKNKFVGDEWHCELEIPLAYLPGGVSTFNSYAIHGTGTDRVYEALYPVTDGTFEEPDFHRLEFFRSLDIRQIVPYPYLKDQNFVDFKYGDMWMGHKYKS